MKNWKSRIEAFLENADELSDRVKNRFGRSQGAKPYVINPFLSFGNAERVFVAGRVLEDEGFEPPTDADNRWRNLVTTYRRFETDEVPGARVKALFGKAEYEATADEEGYFNFEIASPGVPFSGLWQEIGLELIDPAPENGEPARATARVMLPSDTARFGVISDIDDTIVTTNVTNRLKMFLTVAFLNEHTRMPFKGVAAFYRALQAGASGAENNPIFYVSSSPWNLYGLLTEFLRIHQIPLGPLFLKDFGNHILFSSSDHESHKLKNIERILQAYPHLPFVLIGDSGERDPEIYKKVVEKFPTRIRVIYIRSVNQAPERLAAIDQLIEEIKQTGCQLVLAPDSEFAAVHAAGEGLIATSELANVRGEKQEETALPSARELTEEQS